MERDKSLQEAIESVLYAYGVQKSGAIAADIMDLLPEWGYIQKVEFDELIESFNEDLCPQCGSRLKTEYSGVSCAKCAYTFCL